MLNALARLEAVLCRCGVPSRIEVLLPSGGRPRQLSVHALFLGMLMSQADDRQLGVGKRRNNKAHCVDSLLDSLPSHDLPDHDDPLRLC